MKRAAGTFTITVLGIAILVAGVAAPKFGAILIVCMIFAALWGLVDVLFGHHFDAQR